MKSETQFLQTTCSDLLSAPDAKSCCLRLSNALTERFPGAKITLILADRTQAWPVLWLENGVVVEDPVEPDGISKRLKALEAAEFNAGEGAVSLSELTEALSWDGRVVGVVTLQLLEEGASFTGEDLSAVRFLATLATTVIELRRLYAAEQDRLEDEAALIEAGRRLSENLQPEALPVRILEELEQVVPYERGSLLLQDNDNLHIAAQRGFPEDERLKNLNIALRQGDVYDQIATSAKPVLVHDTTAASGWTQVAWLPLNLSWLGLPLFAQNRVTGMVSLTRRERAAFSPEDVLVATAFAVQASVALENAVLYGEVRRFNHQLEQMVQERTEALRQALATLERMDRNKSDFISITAHELRTPLTVMKGYVGILESDPDLQAKPLMRQAINGFLKGTDRLVEIVESMLELARLDNELLELEIGLVAFSAVAKRVESDFNPFFLERQQTFELVNMDRLPVIPGDPNLLLKAVQNVVINAIKYTPNNGKISLAGREVHDEELGPCVELSVQDSGIGIDPEDQALIFEKFYSLGEVGLHSSGKYTFKGGGPGLGLALARGIVQAHKGRIWVESERRDELACPGSTFYILLPIG